VNYTISDGKGGTVNGLRTVTVSEAPDTIKPVITLNGTPTMTIAYGSTYTDLGATCTDNKDSACVVITTGTVNTSVAGTYTITYTSTDRAGNIATATRTVRVTEAVLPNNESPTLTFGNIENP
jgi:Domain of unknown function (DUF5011)